MNINIGQRFAFCNINEVRYSGVAGGKINHLPLSKFQTLLECETLTLVGNKPTTQVLPDTLSNQEMSVMNRRLRYVRKVLQDVEYPTSNKREEDVKNVVRMVAHEIGDDKSPSHSTLARWIKCYISSNQDPMSLVTNTKNKGNRTLRFDPNIEIIINNRIQASYLSKQRLSSSAIYSLISSDILAEYANGDNILPNSIKLPSKRSIRTRIAKLDPYKCSRGRNGMYIANKDFKAAGRGTVATRVLETVEADGNFLDVLIIDEETGEVIGRPYGTCLIDKYSRCILAFAVTMIPFSAATLLKTLKIALSGNNEKFGGVFESMIVDNGSDYISQSVRNFCNHTGIRIEHGAPRDPNSKPHVERFFGTLNSQLVHNLPGTTFSNPSDKGDYKSEKYACLTLSDLNKFIEGWLDTIYHKSLHRGHGRAPEKLWEESVKNTPIITYPIDHLETIAREVEQRHISKGRVTVHNLQWFSHALATVEQDCKNKGTPAKVDVYIDTIDLGKVFIRDPRDHSVFIQADAVFPNYAEGLSLYEHKIIRRKLKEKGKEDLLSYGNHYLEIARWELYESIDKHRKEYSRKRIARIKEVQKRNDALRRLDTKNSETKKPDKRISSIDLRPLIENPSKDRLPPPQKSNEIESFGFRSL